MKKLPKKVYVHREWDGDDWYLVADEKLADAADKDEKRTVGVYELVETLTVTTEVKFVAA